MIEFPGGQEPGPELPCPILSHPPVLQCREDIPTIHNKCKLCGKNPICFLEGSDEKIYDVFDKCKECILGFTSIKTLTQEISIDSKKGFPAEIDWEDYSS